jgi:hypothetical protein
LVILQEIALPLIAILVRMGQTEETHECFPVLINKEGFRTDHAEERLQFHSFKEILHTNTVLNLLCLLLLFSTRCKRSILATVLHWSVDTRQAIMCVYVCVCVWKDRFKILAFAGVLLEGIKNQQSEIKNL